MRQRPGDYSNGPLPKLLLQIKWGGKQEVRQRPGDYSNGPLPELLLQIKWGGKQEQQQVRQRPGDAPNEASATALDAIFFFFSRRNQGGLRQEVNQEEQQQVRRSGQGTIQMGLCRSSCCKSNGAASRSSNKCGNGQGTPPMRPLLQLLMQFFFFLVDETKGCCGRR